MDIKLSIKIGKSIKCIVALVLSMQASFAMDDIYEESGGLVVMETENTASPLGQWIRIEPSDANYVTGATGNAHLEFTGNTFNGGPPNSPLVYKFKVNQDGNYFLHIRARKRLEGLPEDKSNDAYVRMEGDFSSGSTLYPTSTLTQDTKLFGGLEHTWGWATRLDGNGAPHAPAIYNLKAGETYTFTVSGRSIRFNIDRIIFKHSSVTDAAARNPNLPESEFVSNANEPNEPSVSSGPFSFEFDSSTEGWERSSSIEAHVITATGEYLMRAAPNSDPYIFNNDLSFSGSFVTRIRIRMKAEEAGNIQLFWGTNDAGGFSANRVKNTMYSTAGAYEELVFDMSEEPDWVGKTVTQLRVDTTAGSGAKHTWIDYIESDILGYEFNDNTEGWERSSSIEAHAITAAGEYLVRAAPNSDPHIFKNDLSIDGTSITKIRVRIKSQQTGIMQLFWGTTEAVNFSSTRVVSIAYPVANIYQELVFDMSGNSDWVGKTITQLRVDTTAGPTAAHTWFDFIATDTDSVSQVVSLLKRDASEFAIDGGGATPFDGSNVYLYDHSPANMNQDFEEISRGGGFYTYRKIGTNHVLDADVGGADGQNLRLWEIDTTNQDQHWKKIDVGGGYYRLEKRNAPGYSIESASGGAQLQNVYIGNSSNTNQNQHWKFE